MTKFAINYSTCNHDEICNNWVKHPPQHQHQQQQKAEFRPASCMLSRVKKMAIFLPPMGRGSKIFAHRTPPMGRRDPTIRIVKTEFFSQTIVCKQALLSVKAVEVVYTKTFSCTAPCSKDNLRYSTVKTAKPLFIIRI
jgi:hypothetical protein